MATIRELFHGLGNDLNLITVGSGVTRELVEECLEEAIPPRAKEKLIEIVKTLNNIIKDAKEADKKTRDIHDRVYKIIDPDTGKPL